MLLATFKHISSKNADYSAAEAYLTFEHDEFTMKPTLDENGRLIPRQDYRISTLNCGDEDFAIACLRANLRYGKNQKREDVKSHHYIISFDPKDVPDHGLTVDRAQQLGEEFCRNHFPGHQAIVCTHPDGHNGSGNVHVHIVINSLRIEEIRIALSDAVSFEDFAEKLLRRGITVKESRGRLSYLTPDRTNPITARKLGDDFDKSAVFAIFVRNTKRVRAKTDTIHSAPAM